MDRTERFYLIDQLLGSGNVVPIDTLLQRLGVSRATFKRDLEYLRERLHAPIVWDRDARGYRFDKQLPTGPRYELPGLWFSPSQALALITMHQLLNDLEPGLLGERLQPLQQRLELLLGAGEYSGKTVTQRIRISHVAKRAIDMPCFELVATALLQRRRLRILHYNRARDETAWRLLSPQRLLHYRENWYLDAWDHERRALRTFGVDVIRQAQIQADKARDLSVRRLDAHYRSGYGIFAGAPRQRALLRFTPERARWVAAEQWHPDQQTRFDAQGHYLLEVPYADDRELILDICKFGADVEVLKPATLRRRVAASLQRAAAQYAD